MEDEYFCPVMEKRTNFRKIKYVHGHRVLEDGSYYISTTTIKPDGSGTVTDVHQFYENKHSTKEILEEKTFFISEERINFFIKEILRVIGNLRPWEGPMIDDCYGSLEISLVDDSMVLKLDRAISDGEKYVDSLFYSLMENAAYTSKQFQKGEANVYASYHNPIVNVVLDDEENFYRFGEHGICLYFFEEDVNNIYKKTKKMLFSDFVEELVKNNFYYFGYAFSKLPDWMWHTDAYESFTKENLDKFLETAKKQIKNRYLSILER